MTINIILAGVGGQGILSIATVLSRAALDAGLSVKPAEVHGMSQRGGDVMSCLRLSDRPIASDLIAAGQVDMIISLEPMEALRYVHLLADGATVVTSTVPVVNIDNYPDTAEVVAELNALPCRVVCIDADDTARRVATPRAANMVLTGASAPFLPLDTPAIEEAITGIFSAKGPKVVEANLAAFRAGEQIANNARP